MIYLGINVSHNASAAIMINGEIVVAVQEERFTNIKNFTGYPKKSIDYCLQYLRKKGHKIDIAAFSTISNPALSYKVPINHFFNIQDYDDFYGDKFYFKKFKNKNVDAYLKKLLKDKRNKNDLYLPYEKIRFKEIKNNSFKFKNLLEEFLANQSKGLIKKIVFLDHHTCHAYYAYFSPKKTSNKCAVITLDSHGDGCSQTVWVPNKDNSKLIKIASTSECEIARIYKFVTLILSMKPDEHEYKVMGLAPYAKYKYSEQIYEKVFKKILIVKNCKIVHNKRPKDLYAFLKKELYNFRFDNIAAALQLFVEKTSTELLKQINRKYKINHFSISGGVSMNIKMNKVLSELKFVKQLYVSPSGSDESLCMGACYFLAKNKSSFLKNIYLGQNIEILNENKLKNIFNKKYFEISKNVTDLHLAKLLNKGEIIAIARNNEEFGARALGNRSIIANPSYPGVVKKINEYIKNRDFWMPFALTILKEKHKKFIINPKNLRSDFMTIGFDTVSKNIYKIKAGTHPYDETVRPQILERSYNKQYHSLIKKFYSVSGIPAVLNTSLNLHGFPIASKLADIVKTYKKSGLRYLYLNDKFLIKKN
jgi:carbamoyltransferase